MKYRTLGTFFDRIFRNNLNANFEDVDNDIKSVDTKSKQRDDTLQTQLNTLVIEGDSSVEAAQARVEEDGTVNPTLKARLDKKEKETSELLAKTGQQVNSLEVTKANKSEINDLATNKMDKNTTDISVSQINKNKGKFDQTFMTDEFLQQIAGNTPINAIPPNGGVTTEKLANDSATTPKRTPLGEWGLINCDQNAFINFDFANGQIVFDKSATTSKIIRVIHRKGTRSIGSTGVTNSIPFANTGTTPNVLTMNIVTNALNTYAGSGISNVGENEILLATWIGNDPTSVNCFSNQIKVNNREIMDTSKRTPLGENGLIVVNNSKMIDFDFVARVIRIPHGEKKVFW